MSDFQNFKISKKEYLNKYTPYSQGYINYMQGAWNKEIPDENLYKYGTQEYAEFNQGNFQAMLDCQDSEK